MGQVIVFSDLPAPEQLRRQKYHAWSQAKTVRNRATYVGQVDNLPPIVNRPIAGGPMIANRPDTIPDAILPTARAASQFSSTITA